MRKHAPMTPYRRVKWSGPKRKRGKRTVHPDRPQGLWAAGVFLRRAEIFGRGYARNHRDLTGERRV
jgi:hypothetical protein